MKNKVLPLCLLVLISALLFSFTYISGEKSDNEGKDQSSKAAAHFAKLRNNQHTGTIDANDLMRANKQIALSKGAYKSVSNMEWNKMGPDNFSGRTRALLWDNQDSDAKTIYAGCVTGGIWKSTTTGLTWNKINGDNNLMVTTLVQDENGRIYAGTGESFMAQDFSQFGQYGYTGGLQGSGVYYSDDGNNFQPVAGGAQVDDPDWFYVNKMAYDANSQRLFAATNSGLKYSTDGGTTWTVPEYAIDSVFYYISASYSIQCDSIKVSGSSITMYNPDTTGMVIDSTVMASMRHKAEMEGTALDVTVAADGSVAAMVDEGTYSYVFVYQNGGDFVFENKSSNPNNPFLFVKDSVKISYSLTVTYGNDTSYQEIDDSPYKKYKGTDNDISLYAGRIELAFAPSDPNNLYASACYESGAQINIYYSDDKGDSWHIILPGGVSSIDILGENGMYSSTIVVKPDNPHKIFVGGQNLWEGVKITENGYYNWLQKSNNNVSPYNFIYLPDGHHNYAFRPDHNNEFLVGTNEGIFIGLVNPTLYEFEPLMRGYMTSQFYTVSYSGFKEYAMGGAQENGTILVTGEGNTEYAGYEIWLSATGLPQGGTGGYCNIGLINPEVFIYSKVDGTPAFRRSSDAGASFSGTAFADGPDFEAEDFLIPTALWESFNDPLSQDTAKFLARNQAYYEGEIIQVRSNTWEYPFYHELDRDLPQGDSIYVKDIIQSKYFLAEPDHVWMTNSIHDFTQDVIWWDLANSSLTEFEGVPTSMAYSSNANHLFVGTMDGDFFRISNMANAFSEETADCSSDKCIIATKQLPIIDPDTGEEISQVITSVAVDQQDANHVVITLGNYGNSNYVYETRNALDSIADWRPIQGYDGFEALPQIPVYSSLIEMSNSELIIVGTESGIYTSVTTKEDTVMWVKESTGLGDAPVMMLRQQTVYKHPEYVEIITGNDTSYLGYPGTNNYGVIYAATYGRGLYMNDQYQKYVGIDEVEDKEEIVGSIDIYPNPVSNEATIAFELKSNSNVTLHVYNLSGMLVDAYNYNGVSAGQHEIRIDAGQLPKGTYLLQMLTNRKMFANGKFIVIK